MAGQLFEAIPTEEIRAEKMSFKEMIIRCLDRIHVMSTQLVGKNTRASITAYEEGVALLHCFLSPYYSKKYNDEVAEITEELKDFEHEKGKDRLMLLRRWLSLIIKNFGAAGLLPPIDVEYDMASTEEREEERIEKFKRELGRYLRKDESKVSVWIETIKNPPPKPKKKKRKITIEDVIDRRYIHGNV